MPEIDRLSTDFYKRFFGVWEVFTKRALTNLAKAAVIAGSSGLQAGMYPCWQLHRQDDKHKIDKNELSRWLKIWLVQSS